MHEIKRDEGELLDIPDSRIPVRVAHNGSATPPRKSCTSYSVERSQASVHHEADAASGPENFQALEHRLLRAMFIAT
jgi:hypothetical protein